MTPLSRIDHAYCYSGEPCDPWAACLRTLPHVSLVLHIRISLEGLASEVGSAFIIDIKCYNFCFV